MQTTNHVGQRRHNLAVLARAIWEFPGISRRELVDRFNIDESSVSRLVGLLVSMGLVENGGAIEGSTVQGLSSGGRRRIALGIRAGFGQVWGLTLWRDRVRVTIVNVHGETLAAGELPLGPYSGDWSQYLNQALSFACAQAKGTCPSLPVLGIGFAVPGWVDSDTSTIVRSDEFGLVGQQSPRDWPPGLPVFWENDANCGAWSSMGHDSTPRDEVFVLGRFLENGPMGLPSEFSVGFGLVIAGKLQRGWRHKVGEFQSALWQPYFRSPFGVPDEVFGSSRADSTAFAALMTDLMRNLRFVGQFLDPKSVQLGGDLKRRVDAVQEATDRLGWTAARQLIRPLPPETDEVSLGAALLVLDELFQSPDTHSRTLFSGYGTGSHDPVWRGIPLVSL